MTVVDHGLRQWVLDVSDGKKRVGKTGRVLAVDIQREMLQKLKSRGQQKNLDNIEPILGKVDDPRLPVGEVDVVLMVDVYHEFSHPESMLWSIRRSLKNDGVVALAGIPRRRCERADQTATQNVKASNHQRVLCQRVEAGTRVQRVAVATFDVFRARR